MANSQDLDDVKAQIQDAKCAVILDIDETLLNPLYHWQEWLNRQMGLKLSMQQIEQSEGLDNLFMKSLGYSEFVKIAEELRADKEFNSNLPIIEGALIGVQKLLDISGLCLGGYLTTRPQEIAHVTQADLQAKGFPLLPIISRPINVPRSSTVEWKLSSLDTLMKNYNGVLVMIDDSLSLAKAILERNRHFSNFIVAILFNGPLTYSAVHRENMVTCVHEHFYIANWESIPAICEKYVRPSLH